VIPAICALRRKRTSSLDADFYLCGPVGFMSKLAAALAQQGVDADRIRVETFGPSA
jgi:ferredoxin-NADP reductase